MKTIILTPGNRCKCWCQKHTGSDGKDYWVNERTNIVYSTDCHKPNPKEAKGDFKIEKYENNKISRRRKLRRS